MLLRDGRADLVRHTGHGLRLILHSRGAGQILAEASAWSDVYHCDAVASAASVGAVLPRQNLPGAVDGGPRPCGALDADACAVGPSGPGALGKSGHCPRWRIGWTPGSAKGMHCLTKVGGRMWPAN